MNLKIFWLFFRIGCTSFGGLGGVLSQIERELVSKRNLLKAEDVAEALTYTKLLPGSTVVQVVSYLGWKLGGWGGSALATLAFVLPPFGVMLTLSVFYTQVANLSNVQGALRGLGAVVVGLLIVTAYKLGRSSIKSFWGLGLASVALLLAFFLGVPLALIVFGSGLIGMTAYFIKTKRQAKA